MIATWCQREEGATPFTDKDRADLQFLYDEWTHPHFISKEEYGRLLEVKYAYSFTLTACAHGRCVSPLGDKWQSQPMEFDTTF